MYTIDKGDPVYETLLSGSTKIFFITEESEKSHKRSRCYTKRSFTQRLGQVLTFVLGPF